MTRMPFFRFCFAAALATLLVGCPDNTGVAPSGAGDDASPPPPDMGPMEMSVPDVPDVASLEEGPGPLSPRVQNETCRLPPAPPVGAMRLERAFPELTFERPLWMGYAPNDDRFVYFVEQAGRILVADAENPVTTEVFFEENQDGQASRASLEEALENAEERPPGENWWPLRVPGWAEMVADAQESVASQRNDTGGNLQGK